MFQRLTPSDEAATRSLLPASAWPRVDRHASEQLLAIARTDSHILITGSRRMDKAGWARIAHEHSRRATAPMVSVNCAEIVSRGWENALFGQMEMPSSGGEPAMGDPLAAADGGTLFLDEVHALSLASQVKLLRFLEEKQYRRLAETVVRRVDVRVIGATGVDLLEGIRAGKFREDLLAKFQVMSIFAPSIWKKVLEPMQSIQRWLQSHSLRELPAPIED